MTHRKPLSIYEKVSEILDSPSHQNGTVCLRHGFRLNRISHDQDVTSKYLRNEKNRDILDKYRNLPDFAKEKGASLG